MNSTSWYCYAIARPFDEEVLAGCAGVHGGDVGTIHYGDLVAVVSSVPAGEFDESALRAKLEDLAWLEGVARAHNAVVDLLARHTTVLPLRLATIYLDRQRVSDMLAAEQDRLSLALDRVDGRLEWGVKVHTKPADERGTTGKHRRPVAEDTAQPGRSYLRQRKADRDATETTWQQAAQRATAIDNALSGFSTARRLHRNQRAELSGAAGQNVLNVAYLVPTERSDEFLARVRELQDGSTACAVELTGPWAPYSFALDDPSEQPEAGVEA